MVIILRLIYRDKEIKLVECKSFYSRFKGFMLKKNINYALLFKRCNSIHTFFMISNIDVILCDKNDTILYYYNDVKKNKIIWPKRGVRRVYELPVGYFDVSVNEKVEVIR